MPIRLASSSGINLILSSNTTGTTRGELRLSDYTTSRSFLTINTAGNIGIGTTNPSSNLHITAGNVNINNLLFGTSDGIFAGKVGIRLTSTDYALQLLNDSAAKPSTNTWTVSSDERLKTNITIANLQTCYDNVKSIPLKRYTWRNDIYSEEQVPDRSKLGWIAQDVETIFPKAVTIKNMYEIPDCRNLNIDQIIATMYGCSQKLIELTEDSQIKADISKTRLIEIENRTSCLM